jgi:hypothetical protein
MINLLPEIKEIYTHLDFLKPPAAEYQPFRTFF